MVAHRKRQERIVTGLSCRVLVARPGAPRPVIAVAGRLDAPTAALELFLLCRSSRAPQG